MARYSKPSLADIEKQIASLEAQAAALRDKAKVAVIGKPQVLKRGALITCM